MVSVPTTNVLTTANLNPPATIEFVRISDHNAQKWPLFSVFHLFCPVTRLDFSGKPPIHRAFSDADSRYREAAIRRGRRFRFAEGSNSLLAVAQKTRAGASSKVAAYRSEKSRRNASARGVRFRRKKFRPR